MDTAENRTITIQANVNSPVEKVWKIWTSPEHIIKWNNASEDWHTTKAENNLQAGGKFLSRMEAKDGSMGFDFSGVYSEVKTNELIEYTLDDRRNVKIVFTRKSQETKVILTFDAENTHSLELQRTGWQSILDNFKRYTETINQL